MDDRRIIELFNARDESAIAAAESKYGAYCRKIALNLLGVPEDAEECTFDALHAAWKRIPPENPASLSAFLGRMVRNLSITRWRSEHAQKRGGMDELLVELDECVPGSFDVEREVEYRALSESISRWLRTLDERDRMLFIRRCWYGESIAELAAECAQPPAKLSQRLHRLRRALRKHLETEGEL